VEGKIDLIGIIGLNKHCITFLVLYKLYNSIIFTKSLLYQVLWQRLKEACETILKLSLKGRR